MHEPVRRLLWRAVIFALLVRLALLYVGYMADAVVVKRPPLPFRSRLEAITRRWDADQYLRIAAMGYSAQGDDRNRLAYLPLYPAAIRIVGAIVRDQLVAGLLISLVASIAAGTLLQVLAAMDGPGDAASRSLSYLFLFPTAYFLALPYSEALFLALTMGAFLAARSRRWLWAGCLGALGCATRLHGLVLIPALVVEAIHQRSEKDTRGVCWLFLIPFGFAAYLGINWMVLGDPWGFLQIQREHFGHRLILPWLNLAESIPTGSRVDQGFHDYSRLAALSLVFILLVIGRRWLRPSYQVYAWISLVILLSVSWLISVPRYILILFPLFLVLGRMTRSPAFHVMALLSSGLLMGRLFVSYVTWWGY